MVRSNGAGASQIMHACPHRPPCHPCCRRRLRMNAPPPLSALLHSSFCIEQLGCILAARIPATMNSHALRGLHQEDSAAEPRAGAPASRLAACRAEVGSS